ncbi:MAG: nucleotidyltransferase family protein [Bryobacteraceae bacterium]
MDELLEALLLPEPAARRRAWDHWRAGIDLGALPYHCQVLLPALNPSLSIWLADDPAAGIFQGIVRLIWTQNQVHLRDACEVARQLHEAGVREPVVVGPLAWALQATPPAIRAIPNNLMFLVPRADVGKAYQALLGAGWKPYSDQPSGEWLDWSGHISFVRDDVPLHLHWRVLPVKPEDALECERAFLTRLQQVEWNGTLLLTTSPEATLLQILHGAAESRSLPWQADVLLTATPRMNWTSFRKLALRFSPSTLERLRELHQWNPWLAPLLPADDASLLRRKFRLLWSEHRAVSYSRREHPGWLGFLQYLQERWNVPSMWQIPWAGARRALRYGWTLLQ